MHVRESALPCAEAVAAVLAAGGVETVFGVLGSGNLVVTNALVAAGARFFAARHECGAVCMADGFARVSGEVGVVSVHQGPGLTNAMTGIAEAVKSHTPLLVLAADTPAAAIHSNFRIDQAAMVEAVGALAVRLRDPAAACEDALAALTRAAAERRPVVLNLPLDVQAALVPPPRAVEAKTPDRSSFTVLTIDEGTGVLATSTPDKPAAAPAEIARAAELAAAARRPVIVAGRGAVVADAGPALERLGGACGALLATSAPAHGLFAGNPFALGISGGFATPLARELLAEADLVLAFGATLNDWTTRHGTLFGDAPVIQVDTDPTALGRHGPRALAITGDAAVTADAIAAALRTCSSEGWRSPEVQAQIAARAWPSELDAAVVRPRAAREGCIDPRTLTIALDAILPRDRAVAVDSGHFLGWPAMCLPTQDARAWVFPNGFQSVGLGLGCAIGAAVARPERITVAALGDGGCFMALPELETAVRFNLKLLVLVYDDAAYGAEVHHFGPGGHDLAGVRFPDADLAALGRAAGAQAITVRGENDLHAVERWVADGAPGPLVLDAKVDPTICAAWLEDAFRGG
ncbi:MAG TPA: thiamine pyrophosphate-binding protein [Conexibacter sp.]|jgi:thiamine pyrophosphate-dependent acetolactate synthase large subunit-like protein